MLLKYELKCDRGVIRRVVRHGDVLVPVRRLRVPQGPTGLRRPIAGRQNGVGRDDVQLRERGK